MRKTRAEHAMLAATMALLLVSGVLWVTPAQAQSYSGQAYAAFVNVGAGPLYIANTGALPSTGGWLGAEQMGAQVPNVLSAETLVAATSGALTSTSGDQVNSSTSLAGVTVLPGSPAQITASFVRAQADATDSGAAGYSEVDDLVFGGRPVTVTGAPNQTVTIPLIATLVINEQTATAQGILVNALHLILASGGEVIVSSASSSVNR